MTKQVIKLHTIDQWMEVDEATRLLVLQNIKLKGRLVEFLKKNWKELKKDIQDGSKPWAPCQACDTKGWVPTEPRLPGIHPSQLPHPCLLKIYNEMIGEKGDDTIDTRLMLIFDLGHCIHDLLQTYGKKGAWGPTYTKEATISQSKQELSEMLMMEGHADAENILVIDDIPDCPYTFEVGLIHEYKSINQHGYEKLTKPKPEHVTQAMVYSACLNRPIVVYLYFNKNSSDIQDFPVPFNPEIWKGIETKANFLKNSFESKTPPPATPGYHCNSCGYALTCSFYSNHIKTFKSVKTKK